MAYDLILFDVDDTLFDFGASESEAFHKAFESVGIQDGNARFKADYKKISNVLWDELERGVITLQQLGGERFIRLFQLHDLALDGRTFNKVYLSYLSKGTHLMDGAVQLCESLSNYRLAVITNGFNDVQLSRIENSPLHCTFEQIITSEAAGSAKPETKIFDYTFSKLQIHGDTKVLIVGDSLTSDIQGGINYGIDTCWFNPHRKENSVGIEPTYEIHALTDLIEIVQKETCSVEFTKKD